jgi:uncharacterized OsmC-like protein
MFLGVDSLNFGAFNLLKNNIGYQALKKYFCAYTDLAKSYQPHNPFPFINPSRSLIMTAQQVQTINGVAPSELQELIKAVSQDADQGQLTFHASTFWVDGVRSVTHMKSFEWAGQSYARNFTLTIDEPEEIGGTNTGPNPQEVLLSAVNACILATFVSLCSIQEIKLEKLEITSTGKLDLRGFFKLDETVPAGYHDLHWTLTVKGNATPEQFQQVYEATLTASPNAWNLMHPVTIRPELQVEP